MTPDQEIEILRARLHTLQGDHAQALGRLTELEGSAKPYLSVVLGSPGTVDRSLKRPFEYDRQLIKAIDMSRVKDSFKELVESIVFNVSTKQYNRASPKQRLILLRTLSGQHKVKVDFKSTDETTYLQALVDAGVLE